MIRLKLSHDKIAALHQLHKYWAANYHPTTPHELLLFEHLKEMETKLMIMERKSQANYTLSISGSEATAFMQLWNATVKMTHWHAIAINAVLTKIDQSAKRIRGSK
jgi:hypothetical protein